MADYRTQDVMLELIRRGDERLNEGQYKSDGDVLGFYPRTSNGEGRDDGYFPDIVVTELSADAESPDNFVGSVCVSMPGSPEVAAFMAELLEFLEPATYWGELVEWAGKRCRNYDEDVMMTWMNT